MRKLFIILFLVASFGSEAQYLKDSLTLTCDNCPTFPTWKALIWKRADYATNTSYKYPLIIFGHGAGEALDGGSSGSGFAKIYNSSSAGGPNYFINQGTFPNSFTVDGVTSEFLVATPQATTWAPTGNQYNEFIKLIVQNYRIDTNRIYFIGLSAGGAGIVEHIASLDPNQTDTLQTRYYKAAAAVPHAPATLSVPQKWGTKVVKDSIRVWAFGDPEADTHGARAEELVYAINVAKPGYGRFTNTNAGHSAFNTQFSPSYTENIGGVNLNIYQWMLQYSRGVTVASPTANAGSDQTITLPTSSVNLSGSGTAGTGTITGYAWTKISGPGTQSMPNPNNANVTVSGLLEGVYQFRLTVTNSSSATATDDITITVNAAVVVYNKYYVDSAFTGTSDGSFANPYKTVSEANSRLNLANNSDSLFFKRGQIHKGHVYVDSRSGAPGANMFIGAYGTGAKPKIVYDTVGAGNGTGPEDRWVFKFYNSKYIHIDNLDITDPSMDTTNHTQAAHIGIGIYFDGSGNIGNNKVTNCNFSSIGTGIAAKGDSSVFTGNNIRHLRMMKATVGGDDDWGATAFIIYGGSHNTIDNNISFDNYGASPDYVWDGGFSEFFYGNCDSNTVTNNTVTSTNGFAEFGGGSGTAFDNLFSNNIITGVGSLFAIHLPTSGGFPMDVRRIQFLNNTVSELSPVLTNPPSLILIDGTTANGNVLHMQGNTINLSTSQSVMGAAGTLGSNLTHTYNTYNLGATASLGYTADVTETVNIAGVFNSYTATQWYYNNFNLQPGDTLFLDANIDYKQLVLINKSGTPANPIIVMNKNGQAKLQGGDGGYFNLYDCKYIKIIGNGHASYTHGILIQPYTADSLYNGVFALSVVGKSKNIEIANIEIRNAGIGFNIKDEGGCDTTYNYPNWVIDSITIHDNKIVKTWNQGMYIGNTSPDNRLGGYDERPVDCSGTTIYPKPARMGNIKVYNNFTDSTGRAGIQISSASTGQSEVYGNTVKHSGMAGDDNQNAGIVFGNYTVVYCHDNTVVNTLGWGIASSGASGTNKLSVRIENNTIDSSGYLGSWVLWTPGKEAIRISTEPIDPNTRTWPYNIFLATRTTENPDNDSTRFSVKSNVLGIAKNANIGFADYRNTFHKTGNVICSNVRSAGGSVTIQQEEVIPVYYSITCTVPPSGEPRKGRYVRYKIKH